MRRLVALAPLIALVALVAAAAFVLLRGGEHGAMTEGDVGRAAPTFALTRLGGGDLVSSDELAGRAHLVNFFASWCTPCRAEHPQLMALHARGVAIVGVAYKDESADAARFLSNLGDPFSAVAMDPNGRLALDFGVAGAVPETFVIGADGSIRAVHRGPLTAEVVHDLIDPVLAAP